MLRSVKELQGYAISATDGEIGKVDNFYFDDHAWTIRYLVVDVGAWSSVAQRVLISPTALSAPKWEFQMLPVMLTKEQVKTSPLVDTDKPVSRQMEEKLYEHYGWLPYWPTARALAAAKVIGQKMSDGKEKSLNMRSVQETTGYNVKASDGKIGRVKDFVVDDESWIIRYMVIDTDDKQVLISPTWIQAVTWSKRDVYLGISRETVKDSPDFDPSIPVNQEYEIRLYDYYGRPKYWTRVQPQYRSKE